MSELKACPFCGSDSSKRNRNQTMVTCDNPKCFMFTNWYPVEEWQSRPIESALQSSLTVAQEENRRYKLVLERLATAEYTYRSTGDMFVIVDKNGVDIDIQDIPGIAQSALNGGK